jgi:hypothetical protein
MKQESVNNFLLVNKLNQLTAINLSHETTCSLVEATIKILGSYGGEYSFGLRSARM